MKIVLGSDHAGFELKEHLKVFLERNHFEIDDAGTHSTESVDYPDFAEKVAARIASGTAEKGILICGSGLGMCIAANKMPGIRAALGMTVELARLSRQHNDANILCLGGRFLSAHEAGEIVLVWLKTSFDGGRHLLRVNKLMALERAK